MRCSSCEPLLDSYLEGTLAGRKARLVDSHLRSCEACSGLLNELRIVDALLATAHPPAVAPDFTAAVISAAGTARPPAPRRQPIWVAFLFYLAAAWAVIALTALRYHDLLGFAQSAFGSAARELPAFGAALRAVAPATPLAAAVVTAILSIDILLLAATFYGYRRLRPRLAPYLARGPRP